MANSSVAFRALDDAKPLPGTPSRCFIVPSKGSIKRYDQMITISHIFLIISSSSSSIVAIVATVPTACHYNFGERIKILVTMSSGSSVSEVRPMFSTFCRSCVDCGLFTGSYCDFCNGAERIPSERWVRGQGTPLCTTCDARYGSCHYCRGVAWATPPPWNVK